MRETVTGENTSTDPAAAPLPPRTRSKLLTVPNALCALRLLLAPGLIVLAWAELRYVALGLAVFLLLIDWLDGKLAILLKQKTVFGARLDSFADVVLYACVLLALVILEGEMLLRESIWIGLAIASYFISVAAGLIKFRRWPSYHTRLAKTSWLLMVVAILAVFAGWSVWPLRIAMMGVILTNLEATAITFVLPEWRVNVPSLVHALRGRRNSSIKGD